MERGTLQTNTTGRSGECSQWMDHTGFSTAQGGRYFLDPHCSGCRVLCKGTVPSGPCISCISQILECSTRAQTQIGCTFSAFPRSKLLRPLVVWYVHYPIWAMHLIHLPSLGHIVSWVCHKGIVPGVLCLLWELISGCDTPGRCELSRIPGKDVYQLATCSQFVGRCSLGGLDCSNSLPSWSGCSTLDYLPPGREDHKQQLVCSPLAFARGTIFCFECAWGHHEALESFTEKAFFSFSLRSPPKKSILKM